MHLARMVCFRQMVCLSSLRLTCAMIYAVACLRFFLTQLKPQVGLFIAQHSQAGGFVMC